MDKNSTVKLHTGNEMPVLGLGTWQLSNDPVESILYALDQGYRLIDTSSDYGTQPAIGEAIKRTDIPRSELYIVTKVEETDDAYQATQEYIGEMGLAYADLILIHRPPMIGPGIDLWQGLIRAKKEGFTRDIGVSNYSINQIEKLISETEEVPSVNQIEWSPFGYSEEMLQYARNKNMVIQAYSPLTRTKKLDDETLQEIGAKYGKAPAQILIRWNLEQGTVPIPKANEKLHIRENIEVFDFDINEEDIERLNSLNEHYSSLGSLPYV